jgi:hypothetical protein
VTEQEQEMLDEAAVRLETILLKFHDTLSLQMQHILKSAVAHLRRQMRPSRNG